MKVIKIYEEKKIESVHQSVSHAILISLIMSGLVPCLDISDCPFDPISDVNSKACVT